MSQLFINPYINFAGHAREAMEFYHEVFGGDLDLLTFNAGRRPQAGRPRR